MSSFLRAQVSCHLDVEVGGEQSSRNLIYPSIFPDLHMRIRREKKREIHLSSAKVDKMRDFPKRLSYLEMLRFFAFALCHFQELAVCNYRQLRSHFRPFWQSALETPEAFALGNAKSVHTVECWLSCRRVALWPIPPEEHITLVQVAREASWKAGGLYCTLYREWRFETGDETYPPNRRKSKQVPEAINTSFSKERGE